MLITLFFVLLIILGVVLINKCYDDFLGSIAFGAGIIGIILCLLIIAVVQIPKQAKYEKAVMRREMLEYRLEHKEDEQSGNELLYSDILQFNQNLYSAKKWSKNLWVNWFWNEKIAELDYIDYLEADGDKNAQQ